MLRLLTAARAAAEECERLVRSCRLLEHALDEPERTLFIARESEKKRAACAIKDDDGCDAALAAERTAAVRCRDRLRRQHVATKRLALEFQAARARLAEHVRHRKRGLGLNSDVTSGAGAAYPPPAAADPPVVGEVRALCEASVEARCTDAEAMAACSEQLGGARQRIAEALAAAQAEGRRRARELASAQGQLRLEQARVARAAHRAEIAQQRNEGPAAGSQYLAVAERMDRPLMREYNRAAGHATETWDPRTGARTMRGAVTAFEEADESQQQFEATRAALAVDATALGEAEAALDSIAWDRQQTLRKNAELQRLRTRIRPSRRM